MYKVIGNYSFHYISQKFNLIENLENNEHLQKSSTIMIHHYENTNDNGYGLHIIIGFHQTILVIESSLLPNIQSYLTKNKIIKICFFPETKNIFNQNNKFIYNESEFHKFFLEEIESMNNNLFTQDDNFLKIIKSCISGYLIKESYNDLNFDRIDLFKGTSIESNNSQKIKIDELREINENEIIYLRIIGYGSRFISELIYHIEDKKLYVVKKPNSYDHKIITLLNREINNYLEISHPFIPKLIGKIIEKGISYPVIEFINGCDMITIQYSANEMFIIMFQLLIVFDYLHKNKKIYRDLKPNNIMIDEYKNLVLIDFDRTIDEDIDRDQSQITTDFFSKFAAPEFNYINVTNKCDIYSIGKTFEYIINELKSKNVEIPYYKEIEEIISDCTNKFPNNRPDINKLILSFANLPISQKIIIDKINPNMQKLIGKVLFSKDISASIYYYSLAANQNDQEAQLNLGIIYYEDKYVPQNFDKALRYLFLAAKQHNKKAVLYINSISDNKCTITDLNNSTHIYSITSNHNFPEVQFCIGVIYYMGTYYPQNINAAIYFFTLAAKQNHPQAQCSLGLIYYEGKHVKKDISKAIYYFTLASDQDDPFASYYLGKIYYLGIDIPQNNEKTIQYLIKAANHNFVEAQFILGEKYYDGEVIKHDIEKSIHYYEMAANQNHADALYQLGEIYYEGIDVSRDIEKAIHYLSLAANQKHSEAQFLLGLIYFDGKYVIPNIGKAIHYLLLAAKQNHPEALYVLALLYHEGKYVPYNINKAIKYYSLSAKQNKPEAQLALDAFYFEGDKFISKNIEKIIKYCTDSAKQNDLDSQLLLGALYQYGEYVVRDINKAIYYFSLAADKHNSRVAQYHLGEIYYENDIEKSIRYLKLASNQNCSKAQFLLAAIYNEGEYIPRNINKAYHYLFLSAQNNNKEAQYRLANDYLYGSEFIAQDFKKGIHYLTLSADQNYSEAQLLLGHIYYLGFLNQNKNINKGIYWYQRASENKCIQAYFVLGFLYQEGKYLKFDDKKSIYFYKEASSFYNQYAKNNLCIIYKHGLKDIIQKNLSDAKVYFKEAINQANDHLAMYNLALIYIYEDKTDESIKESIKLLIKSSKLVELFESTILLILILIRNYQANNKNFKNVLLNFTDKENEDKIFADKLIKSNYQIIENLCFLNTTLNGKYEEIYLNFKENDLLYQINLQPILAKDVNIGQERKTIYEKYNITKDFYLGFEY